MTDPDRTQDENGASDLQARTGGEVVADALLAWGVTRGFCVPGESYLGLLGALDRARNAFDLVVCRHEGSAAYMAEAYGRMTGRPGVCLVTRGPGASNALIGVATAAQESTPMVLIIGNVSTGSEGRFAFQEIDVKSVFGSVAKWVGVVQRPTDIPHMVGRALSVATSGRPGPVVLAVPDNVQFERVTAPAPVYRPRPAMVASAESVARVSELVSASERPLLLLGGNGWNGDACADIAAFARAHDLPVATTFRRNDLIGAENPSYVGSFGPGVHPAMVAYAAECDLLMLVGGRLGEIETGRYAYLSSPDAHRTFIHAAALSDEFGEVLEPDLAIVTDVAPLCSSLAALDPPAARPWADRRAALRSSFEAYREPVDFGDKPNPGRAVVALQGVLPDDAIVTMGAGNYTHFVLRHHRFQSRGTLYAPLSAPMGYSIPAAVSAALEHPDREVVAYVGDGCFFMNPQELTTAAARNLRLTVVMFNNGIYGSIRMHEELAEPGMAVATQLHNPDFQVLAKSLGIAARRVTEPADVAVAYEELRAEGKGPIFIELVTDPEVITPQMTIADIRNRGRK